MCAAEQRAEQHIGHPGQTTSNMRCCRKFLQGHPPMCNFTKTILTQRRMHCQIGRTAFSKTVSRLMRSLIGLPTVLSLSKNWLALADGCRLNWANISFG